MIGDGFKKREKKTVRILFLIKKKKKKKEILRVTRTWKIKFSNHM